MPSVTVSTPSSRPQAQPPAPEAPARPSDAHRAVSNVPAGGEAAAGAESLPTSQTVSNVPAGGEAAAGAESLPTSQTVSPTISSAQLRLRRLGMEPVEGYRPPFRSEVSNLVERRGEEREAQAAEEADFVGARDAFFASRARVGQETPEFLGGIVAAIGAISTAINVGRSVVSAIRGRETGGITPGQPSSLVEVVIGEDDRTRIPNTDAAPWNGICQLNIRAADGTVYRGSGWLIGPQCVISAGHCVYMQDAGGWVSSIRVAPGRDANMYPFPPITSQRFESTNGWVENNDRDSDYAAIYLPSAFDPVNGTTPYQFTYAGLDDSQLRNVLLNCVGYSADDPSTGKDGTCQWFHARTATQLTARVITYDIDTGGGASGCPVFIVNPATGARTCVGIHTNGFALGNSATRITADVAANLDRWRLASAA